METLQFTIKQMSALLVVVDLKRSLDFYIGELGFVADFQYEHYYSGLVKDGFSLHLKAGKPSTKKAGRRPEDVDILFSVEGIQDLYAALIRRPIKVTQPLRTMPYGTEFYIADPDGYILAFVKGIYT